MLFLKKAIMTATKKKSWQEKFDVSFSPKIEKANKSFAGIETGQMMLIPTPALVDAYVRQIPKGKFVDTKTLREDLAAEYHAEVTCPLTTGIFLRIVAELALEKMKKGVPVEKISPFWRVIDPHSPTAKKLTCGPSFIEKQRKKEAKS
jgi:hypothetical protein